jgi:hypothetical protein
MRLHYVRLRWLAAMLMAMSTAGCTPPLIKYRTDVPGLQLSVVGQPPATDGRARFREIYCGVSASTPDSTGMTCETALVRLSDEPPARSYSAALPQPDPKLHILFVAGAFGECFQNSAPPVAVAIAKLSALGYRLR